MSDEIPKATKEVTSYLTNIFRQCYHDCCDSSEEAEKHQHRFNAIVGDDITIGDYIEEYCLEMYAAKYQSFYDSDLRNESWVQGKKDLTDPVFSLPVPLEKIWDKLNLEERHKK